EKDGHLPQKDAIVEVPQAKILAVLNGDEPHRGKVFGCDTSRVYKGRKTHDKFGPLYWFYRPEGDVGDRVVRAFDKAYKTLKKNGLEFLIQPETCVWEIVPANGERYAGMYRRSANADKNPNRLIIRPEVMEEKDWVYCILHELSHHLHFEFLSGSKLEGSWVRLYNKSIKVTTVKKEDSQRLLDDLLGQESRPSDFRGQLGEDDAEAFKWILKAIKAQSKISLAELDLLFEADYGDDIRAVWPVRGVTRTDLDPLITEYATKNFKETLAEAVSWHLVGLKLPKEVVNLVEKTLSYVKSNH
ncbi:hypothetical protein P2L35_13550, partial [Enterococcus faecium]